MTTEPAPEDVMTYLTAEEVAMDENIIRFIDSAYSMPFKQQQVIEQYTAMRNALIACRRELSGAEPQAPSLIRHIFMHHVAGTRPRRSAMLDVTAVCRCGVTIDAHLSVREIYLDSWTPIDSKGKPQPDNRTVRCTSCKSVVISIPIRFRYAERVSHNQPLP